MNLDEAFKQLENPHNKFDKDLSAIILALLELWDRVETLSKVKPKKKKKDA